MFKGETPVKVAEVKDSRSFTRSLTAELKSFHYYTYHYILSSRPSKFTVTALN